MTFPLRLILLFAVLAAPPAPGQDLSHVPAAERAAAARLFKAYREGADPAARERAAEALAKMNSRVVLELVPMVERDFQAAVTNYCAALQRLASEVARNRMADPAFAREVAALRAGLAKLRAEGKRLTKERIQSEGGPALKRLRELLVIPMGEIVALQFSIGAAGEEARALTRIRMMLKTKAQLEDDHDYTEADFERDEAAAMARAFRRDPKTDAVLASNAALAASLAVPADEAEGVRDLNEIRMLLGLAPVLIDPRLHDAARGHSKDMVTLRFFAHESKVRGKKTLSDRARLAGTTARAENVYAGDRDPHAANRAWFSSPGHHVNMLANYRRVGMGRYEGHWTQMFGR